jgi:hypothetical protein
VEIARGRTTAWVKEIWSGILEVRSEGTEV